MSFETTRYDKVGSRKLLCFILDPERLNSLANKFVRIALFGISEASPGFPVDEEIAVHLGLQQNAGRVAEDGRYFSCLVGLSCQRVDTLVVVVRVHRRLSANEEERVV